MGEEIWQQTDGRIDAFVQSVGTAGSLRGNGEGLRATNEQIRIVAVEPSESAVLSGGPSGAHKIDGVGAGFVVPLWRDDIADQIERVSTEEAATMAMRLAREEGLFAGTSTGANVVAALRLAERLGPDATIVTVMCDSGMKYLSSALYLERKRVDAPSGRRVVQVTLDSCTVTRRVTSPKLVPFLCVLSTLLGCAGPSDDPDHLLLVVFDTLRPDRMSVSGYPVETTPFLVETSRSFCGTRV